MRLGSSGSSASSHACGQQGRRLKCGHSSSLLEAFRRALPAEQRCQLGSALATPPAGRPKQAAQPGSPQAACPWQPMSPRGSQQAQQAPHGLVFSWLLQDAQRASGALESPPFQLAGQEVSAAVLRCAVCAAPRCACAPMHLQLLAPPLLPLCERATMTALATPLRPAVEAGGAPAGLERAGAPPVSVPRCLQRRRSGGEPRLASACAVHILGGRTHGGLPLKGACRFAPFYSHSLPFAGAAVQGAGRVACRQPLHACAAGPRSAPSAATLHRPYATHTLPPVLRRARRTRFARRSYSTASLHLHPAAPSWTQLPASCALMAACCCAPPASQWATATAAAAPRLRAAPSAAAASQAEPHGGPLGRVASGHANFQLVVLPYAAHMSRSLPAVSRIPSSLVFGS